MDSYSASLLGFIVFAVVLRLSGAARMGTIGAGGQMATPEYVRTYCQLARYPDVCVKTLLPYVGSVWSAQNVVVKAAVNESLFQARNVSKWAARLARSKGLSQSEVAALRDCVQNFGDTYDEIRESLTELKHLRSATFRFQMSNVQTWMSAALTNVNSCLDGFEEVDGSVKEVVSCRVENMSQLISNALALVNQLAASGGY